MNSLEATITRVFHNHSFGVFLIRVALGLLFFTHGLMKVQQLSMAEAMFVHFGFFPWVGFFIAWLEVIGGLALVLGIATRFFGLVFGIEMLVATFLIGFAQGISIELLLCLVSFSLMFIGSGRLSVYKFKRTVPFMGSRTETVVVVE
jgi:uncharacterized membrane protein YphA (DoxX/SURF4 family)